MLAEIVREAARRFAGRIAYVEESTGSRLTYADLDRHSDATAVALARSGVGVGDVVGLVLPPSLDYLVAYVAAAKLGAITAGVNDRLAEREREAVLAIANPTLVLASEGRTTDDFPCIELASYRDLSAAESAPPSLAADPGRDVAIIFTSGTTGVPKGARYGNRQLACITQIDIGDAWDLGGTGITGTSFAHLGFMTKLPGNLRRGGTTFIMRKWSARSSLEMLQRERLSTLAGVPTQVALMLAQPDFDEFDLSSVQYIVVGGGPVTPGLAAEARRRFDARLATRYSCTEAGVGLGTGFDDPLEDAVVSVGRPHPGIQLAIRDPDEPERSDDIALGEVGEVCLRSGACMTGYWHDETATRAAFTADGYVRTGDLGRLDEAGRLRLVGRSKEMYVRGGYNVYPVEVEAVLSTHPKVAAVAVAPRDDVVMGEVGVAFVVARDGVSGPTLAELREHGGRDLAAYKLPEDVRFVDALPLTPMEKLDRRALRDLDGRT